MRLRKYNQHAAIYLEGLRCLLGLSDHMDTSTTFGQVYIGKRWGSLGLLNYDAAQLRVMNKHQQAARRGHGAPSSSSK